MIESLKNELWSRMREHIRHAASSEQLKVMKIGGETDRVVTLFVFEPGLASPTFAVKIVRRLEDETMLRREAAAARPRDGQAGGLVLIDLQGIPALVLSLQERPEKMR